VERVEVGGHAAEWNGHAVVIEFLRVVGGQVGEQELVDAALADDGVMKARTVAEADGDGLGKLVLVLAAAVAQIGIGRLKGEDAVEGIAGGDGAELVGLRPDA